MSILKDGVTYLLAEFISKITPFLVIPYLTRIMGASDYGVVSYYQTVILLILIFVSMSQEGAITRYYYKYGKKSLISIVNVCYLYNFLITFFLILFFYVIGKMDYIILTLIASFQSLFNVQLSLRQCQKKAIQYFFLQCINSFALVFSLIYFFNYGVLDNLKSWMFSFLFSYFLGFIISYINFSRNKKENFRVRKIKIMLIYFLSFGIPLLLHQFSMFAKGQFDKIYIYNYFDSEKLGVYSAGVQLASIVSVGLMALNKALLPYYFDFLKNKKIRERKILLFSLVSFCIVPLPPIFFSLINDNIYALILGEGFQGVKQYTIIFSAAFMLILPYLIVVNYLFYHGKVLVISIISFFSLLCYLISLYYFSNISIYKVPYSILICNLVQIFLLYLYILGKNLFNVRVLKCNC
ncbi:oligosaccharide flippase family protein [Acinetobacter zhairhuonensis]|uniref:oligosaccharide flippase family protein n=1 Tax=Acinetobacter sp. A7.4 TaxID=2919921 RepID=UPI001F4F5D63|nr:oligosaccharide flippase family protein [Acinetobacter sp. A7.4]MCJ8161550.1 oligosaccharide flippase family protein [Acinetobacter sp. A7.4]